MDKQEIKVTGLSSIWKGEHQGKRWKGGWKRKKGGYRFLSAGHAEL